MPPRFYDAHNHLQDERFGGRQPELLIECVGAGVACMVVNGSCEEDWQQVLELAQAGGRAGLQTDGGTRGVTRPTLVLPSFGYHPWYIHERTKDWEKNLVRFLDAAPSAVGEIGLDRWKLGLLYKGQEEVFIAQLRIAAERNLPVSIHCLQAWGRMLEILKAEPRPRCGFLLHSYGGPKEMVKSFADLGAYFSLPGFYVLERKERQRETFRHVPAERLLIETDAPDQALPEAGSEKAEGKGWRMEDGGWQTRARFHELVESQAGRKLNHPANLALVYAFAAELFGESLESLATRVEENFLRLFGGLLFPRGRV